MKVLYADGDRFGRVVVHIQLEGMPRGTVTPKSQPPIKLTGASTNNEAEWEGFLYALELVDSYVQVEIRLDSLNVVNWMEGSYRTRDQRMREYKRRAQRMIVDRGLNVCLKWVRREQNKAGHRLEDLPFPEWVEPVDD
ncbi:hypothetical protein ES705_44476 [subsurface metagenome]